MNTCTKITSTGRICGKPATMEMRYDCGFVTYVCEDHYGYTDMTKWSEENKKEATR